MGWFEATEGSGLILGDDPLDLTHRFLKELAELYEEGCERKPTLAEVIACLESGLKFSGSECIADLEERAVTQVTVKTKKKPKDQTFKVGDVIAIPLDKNTYAFARIMIDDRHDGMLMEIFRETSPDKSFRRSIIESGRLFSPITGARSAIKNCRWHVIRSGDQYVLSESDAKMEFRVPHFAGGRWTARRFGGKHEESRLITKEEAMQLEDTGLPCAEDVEERIKRELRERSR